MFFICALRRRAQGLETLKTAPSLKPAIQGCDQVLRSSNNQSAEGEAEQRPYDF